MSKRDAIVVGGGFAGVTAHRDLSRAGLDAVLLEARDRLGGRTWYKDAALAGRTLEMGGQYIQSCQSALWPEIERYGIAVTDVELPTQLTWLQDGELRSGPLPAPFEELGGVERLLSLCSTHAARIDPARPLGEQGLADLDVPLADFAAAADLGPCAADLAASFFGLFTSTDWREASALHFLLLVHSSGGTIWDFLTSSLVCPNFADGSRSLIDAMAADAEAEVLLSSPVEAIAQREDGVAVTAGGTELTASCVVLALPLNVLASVAFDPPLPADKLALAERGHAGRGSKVWAVVEGMPDDFFALGNDETLHYVAAHERIGDGVLASAFGPDAGAIDADDPRDVERCLRAYLPGCRVVASHGHDWHADPYARGTWTAFRPQQATVAHALARREGRLLFAGTETARRWPGYIDGAIESGARAAAESVELLRAFGAAA